jgi:hypothetical protein
MKKKHRDEIRKAHRRNGRFCNECIEFYPCETIELLDDYEWLIQYVEMNEGATPESVQ